MQIKKLKRMRLTIIGFIRFTEMRLKMAKEPVYEAAACENDKDTAEKLLLILKDCEKSLLFT